MHFEPQRIPGVWLIRPEPHRDARGELRRHFCAAEFLGAGLDPTVRQANIAENPSAGTLRGFHYQLPAQGENKVISCLRGTIYDVVVDLRRSSPTWLTWQAFDLDDRNQQMLYVPIGCANAYLTRQAHTLIHYYHSEFFVPESYRGFRWNDPLLGVTWPAAPVLVSEKDSQYPDLDLETLP